MVAHYGSAPDLTGSNCASFVLNEAGLTMRSRAPQSDWPSVAISLIMSMKSFSERRNYEMDEILSQLAAIPAHCCFSVDRPRILEDVGMKKPAYFYFGIISAIALFTVYIYNLGAIT